MKKRVLSNYIFPYSLYTNKADYEEEAKSLTSGTQLPAMKEGTRYGKNAKIAILHDEKGDIVLRIFRGSLNFSREKLTDYKLIVDDIEHQHSYALLIAYNEETDKYYVAYDQIEYHIKHGHYLNIDFAFSNDGTEPMKSCYDDFQPFSELSIMGYKVGKKGLPDSTRHMLIRHILEKKIMYCYELVEFLQTLIMLREEQYEKDFSKSIRDWKNDLQYIYEECLDLIEEEHKREVKIQKYDFHQEIHRINGINSKDYCRIYFSGPINTKG